MSHLPGIRLAAVILILEGNLIHSAHVAKAWIISKVVSLDRSGEAREHSTSSAQHLTELE